MADICELIKRFRQGDKSAAEIIYSSYHYQVYEWACLILGNEADAEEVAQDALVDMFRNIAKYNPDKAKFITWLRKITLNRCRKKLREQRKKSIIPRLFQLEFHNDLSESVAGPEDQSLRQEQEDEVWEAIQTLRPSLREAVLLRYYGECTFREIADIQRCKIRTAQSRVRLAHEKLQELLYRNDAPYALDLECKR